jgi:hypothetical protein
MFVLKFRGRVRDIQQNPLSMAFNTSEGWSMSHRTLRALLDREAREGDLSESAKAIVERALDNATLC